ncbi:MAG: cellulase family glycosylhydrolase [Phycisphaerae bacterium]|nr:cellulase family glycosylhydrolase [Phycisphaerae bacterium]
MKYETLNFERDTVKRALIIVAIVLGLCAGVAAGERWSKEKANEWYQEQGWLVGCNFGPSTAINQLEMWQGDTFDAGTIDRELGWAAGLGFNSIRVYLHDLVWKEDSKGFIKRIGAFLNIADKHGIGVMFVLLDGCWDPFPKAGKQREPRPHVHNSGWVQSPGAEILKDPSRHDEMEGYVKGVIGRFRKDKRVDAWDLFNEPDNPNVSAYGRDELKDKAEVSLMLLKKAFAWAREVGPEQPITAGPWRGDWSNDEKLGPMDRFLLEESDIITFHCYSNIDEMKKRVVWLKRFGRPILCTEYMTRVTGSTFGNILPFLKEQNVAAYNWGCVAGKTQTIYPWESWRKKYTSEPPVWFHDIFRKDGTPYRAEETAVIRELTGKAK